MSHNSIENNPFAALFPSVDQAQLFASKHDQEKSVLELYQTKECHSLDEDEVKELTKLKTTVSHLLEKVFLITLDNEESDEYGRPDFCVYMSDLAENMDGQTWLDMDTIQQAVFERLLMQDPQSEVIRTWSGKPSNSNVAGEPKVLMYLFQCFERCNKISLFKQNTEFKQVEDQCCKIILMNAQTCLQQPDLYAGQDLHKQFIHLYIENSGYLCDSSVMEEFLIKVSLLIEENKEDGSLLTVFTPVLDTIRDKFQKEFTLMHHEVNSWINLVLFFTKNEALAQVLMEYNAPSDWSKGKDYERTLLGSIIRLNCLPEQDKPHEFFQNPSSTTKQEHSITEKNIWLPLSGIVNGVYNIVYGIIKISPNMRHMIMSWLGKCIHANSGRAKIWSSQAPQVFNQLYCSDGFSLNLCSIMLKLCQPFSEPCSPKLLKIQCSYTKAIAADDSDCKRKSIHAEGLNKETCLIPQEDRAPMPLDEMYTFITECFFLCHQAINQGFHAVHEKFIKINQELHRIQQAYMEMRPQYPNEDQEPMRSFKTQMEKGMTLFLCIKAALTEPQMLEMSMNFHIATSTWLVQAASFGNVTTFEPVRFPLPQEVPLCLTCIPEFIMGNITDFTMFLHRFKDEMFETSGDRLEHLMTLIMVFMGSPDRMKNPHLRAELAETLAALLPQNPDSTQTRQGNLSKYYREMMFENHPLMNHLSEKLLNVFVTIEMTGQSVQFEQKFNYRRPMYQVLHYIWEKDLHKEVLKKLAEEAEKGIENQDPPLFLRFINLLINDAIFLLDEALDFMKQLKEKQQIKDGPEWENMNQRQRQEFDGNVRQMGNMARYHNVMGNKTIYTLQLLTDLIKTIFCHDMMVDRIAAMLNYFLLHLVGPKQRDLKVKDKTEYEFKPQELVSDITKIYLHLGEDESFCKAVCGDGRSYSDDLMPKAASVLLKIGSHPFHVSDFQSLHYKITEISKAQLAEEELLADAPDEFLDPIMGTLMRDPVLLPTSGQIVEKAVISRHLLSDQMDPFNRQPLSLDMVKPDTDLKDRINRWIKQQKAKYLSSSNTASSKDHQPSS